MDQPEPADIAVADGEVRHVDGGTGRAVPAPWRPTWHVPAVAAPTRRLPLDELERVRAAAKGMLTEAFGALERARVLPTSQYHPYLEVGRDYKGYLVMNGPAFTTLVDVIEQLWSDRFEQPLSARRVEFARWYVFMLLEATIARLTTQEEPLTTASATVEECVIELCDVLSAPDLELACCHHVSELTTSDGEPLRIGGVTVRPLHDNRYDGLRAIKAIVPKAGGDLIREDPFTFARPEALIVARGRGADPDDLRRQLSGDVQRLQLALRLLYASRSRTFYSVTGETTLICGSGPVMRTFEGPVMPMVGRPVTLGPDQGEVLVRFSALLDEMQAPRAGMFVTSFDLALLKFTESYAARPWWDQIVDLATALEATLSGQDKEDVGLRLKLRAAALLACPLDPAEAIFEDLATLYDLRSKLVHGNSLKANDLTKCITRVSTIKAGTPNGVATEVVVDRLRDLVRRSILARVMLSNGTPPLWPLTGSVPIDRTLSDDTKRAHWRTRWRAGLAAIGAEPSADPAPALRTSP